MTDAQRRQLETYAYYILLALVGAFVATGLAAATMVNGSGDITARPLVGTFLTSFFGTLSTTIGATYLPRPGSEAIASQVDDLKRRGISKAEMVVLTQDEAALALGPQADLPPAVQRELEDR